MTDLIERLREYDAEDKLLPCLPPEGLVSEVADELERLRRELADAEASDKESLSLYHACRDRADGYLAQIAQLERELAEAERDYDKLTGQPFSRRVHVALLARFNKTESTLERVFEYYGPPAPGCECFICDLQREYRGIPSDLPATPSATP